MDMDKAGWIGDRERMTEICPQCGQIIDHENDVQVSYAELLREFELRNMAGLWCDIGFVRIDIDEHHRRRHVELDATTTDKIIRFLKLIEHEGIIDDS